MAERADGAAGVRRFRADDPFGRDVDGGELLRAAVGFGRELRTAGLGGDLAAAIDFARILSIVDIGDREQVRAGGATLFVRRREDLPIYDEVFARFWRARFDLRPGREVAPRAVPRRRSDAPGAPPDTIEGEGRPTRRAPVGVLGSGTEPAEDRPTDGTSTHPMAYSPGETVRHREFDRMSSAELREAERLIQLLAPNLELRRTRRQELHPHGRFVAPRAMFRRNIAMGGEALDWVWQRSVRRPRSIVVLCDISGSMERNARLLLRFVHAIARTGARTEAFVFGTRLTRVTRELREREPGRAMERIGQAASDWSGGTRIGDSFRAFNLRWARRVLRTSGVVIVMSDGWDRGDPGLVAAETARLRRNCHRLIWLNPLAGSQGYQPLAAGMAAAYPFIDDFVAAGSVASLERLGEILAGQTGGRRPGAHGRGASRGGRRGVVGWPADEAAAGSRASVRASDVRALASDAPVGVPGASARPAATMPRTVDEPRSSGSATAPRTLT